MPADKSDLSENLLVCHKHFRSGKLSPSTFHHYRASPSDLRRRPAGMWTLGDELQPGACAVAKAMAFSPGIAKLSKSFPMPHTTGYFHLHLVSDATGETLITVAKSRCSTDASIVVVESVIMPARSCG